MLIDKDLVSKLREKLLAIHESFLEIIDERDDLEIVARLDDDVVEELALMVLEDAGRPLLWRELKLIFSGVVGEGRLRRALYDLAGRGRVLRVKREVYGLRGSVN